MPRFRHLLPAAAVALATVALSACAEFPLATLMRGEVVKPRANVVQNAEAIGTFRTLLAAANASGLTEELSTRGPITVFAPTDGAFNQLPAGAVENLMKPANRAQLARLVRNHVVPRELPSNRFLNGRSTVTTMAGRDIQINALDPDKGMWFGSARITKADIQASNGTIHIINKVVLP